VFGGVDCKNSANVFVGFVASCSFVPSAVIYDSVLILLFLGTNTSLQAGHFIRSKSTLRISAGVITRWHFGHRWFKQASTFARSIVLLLGIAPVVYMVKGLTSDMNLKWKQVASIAFDLLVVCVAYYFWHWFGFALAVFFFASVHVLEALTIMQTTRDVLLSRLPDRCAMCHREIVDEGGIMDDDLEGELRIYQEACHEKLESIKSREKLQAEN